MESAVWDLYAKMKGVSLASLLSGSKKSIEVGVSIGIQENVNILIEKVGHYIEEGYRRIKVKIKPGWDVQVIDKIRKHFPNIPLMADANSAYTLEDIEVFKQLDEYNLMMIEQPLAHDDIIDHSKLQKEIRTPKYCRISKLDTKSEI